MNTTMDGVPDSYDVLVAGGGPAGLTAAATAAGAGATVLLVDENPELGGQYLRALPAGWGSRRASTPTRKHRDRIVADLRRRRGAVLTESSVFDLRPGYLAGIHSRTTSDVRWIRARSVIVATGAYESVMPFPGWTLPGVMTLGGAQNLAKSQGLLPGDRVVLSGTGPFLWLVAANLLRRGARVIAVADALPLYASLRFALRAWSYPGRAVEAASYWLSIVTRSRLLFGHAAVAADGDGRLERITIARLDRRSGVVTGTERGLAADALCVSYGLVPDTELTRLMGCEHRSDPVSGAFVPVVGDLLETSSPGLFAAGEVIGVAGWQVAEDEGRAAGIGAARRLGLVSDERALEIQSRHRSIRRQRAFTEEMLRTYRLGVGALSWSRPETIACRCEEITVGRVQQAIEQGDRSTDAVKSRTRAGMGRCQGRVCGSFVQRIVSGADGGRPAAPFVVRAPLRPISIRALIDAPALGGTDA